MNIIKREKTKQLKRIEQIEKNMDKQKKGQKKKIKPKMRDKKNTEASKKGALSTNGMKK